MIGRILSIVSGSHCRTGSMQGRSPVADGLFLAYSTLTAIDLARLMQNIRASIASSTEPMSSSPQQRHYQLSSSRTSAFDPPTVSTSVPMGNFAGPSKSLNVYTRMVTKDGKETLFELRGHPYFGELGRALSCRCEITDLPVSWRPRRRRIR